MHIAGALALVPPYAPADYPSDMPAFAGKLSDDDIWAVLAFIKSRWTTPGVLQARREMTRRQPRAELRDAAPSLLDEHHRRFSKP